MAQGYLKFEKERVLDAHQRRKRFLRGHTRIRGDADATVIPVPDLVVRLRAAFSDGVDFLANAFAPSPPPDLLHKAARAARRSQLPTDPDGACQALTGAFFFGAAFAVMNTEGLERDHYLLGARLGVTSQHAFTLAILRFPPDTREAFLEAMMNEHPEWETVVRGAAAVAQCVFQLCALGFHVFFPTVREDAQQSLDLIALHPAGSHGYLFQVKSGRKDFTNVRRVDSLPPSRYADGIDLDRTARNMNKLYDITWTSILVLVGIPSLVFRDMNRSMRLSDALSRNLGHRPRPAHP